MSTEPLLEAFAAGGCIFCGYNGQGYWQAGTHATDCPWFTVAGAERRTEDFFEVLKDRLDRSRIQFSTIKVHEVFSDDFWKVGEFHQKFQLPSASCLPTCDQGEQHQKEHVPHHIPRDLIKFRLTFLIEELKELADAYGIHLEFREQELARAETAKDDDFTDLPQVADALVDLVYVALGTAHLHGLPWVALFNEVHRANMTKERSGIDHRFVTCFHGVGLCTLPMSIMCHHREDKYLASQTSTGWCGREEIAHSLRGSAYDVIKPPGWKKPAIAEVLSLSGWPCDGNHAAPACANENCWQRG